ncbi:hypothetical protein FRY74_06615 [Vicingus serpentipes]|uniref:Porin n=1 Tax=Vicingus serpentipes TaxID=1926625 RepID=A0A5C6RS57_9FLAO|nr:putative porin [Vicingus serpentipes]TXB65093.1 hypothetical protein FRY74_06615 [Vicingus serpentipes]
MKQYFFILFIFNLFTVNAQQETDSLAQTNKEYETVLFNDNNFLDILFYKHFNNTPISNLGTYGSSFYFPTTYNLDNQKNVFAPTSVKDKLFKLEGFKPFTNLTWINAGRREQILSLNHIQKFGKLASLHFNYKRVSSPGIYINQEANQNLFTGDFRFNTDNNLYQLRLAAEIDRIENQENGGLADITDFEKDSLGRRSLYTVNNEQSYYTLKQTNVEVSQRLNFINSKIDSIRSNKVYVGLENEYNTKRRSYFDYDISSPIYAETYLDSTSKFWVDSTFAKYFRNTINLGFDNGKFSVQGSFDYYQHEYNQFMGIDSNFNSFYAGLMIGYKTNKTITNANFSYGLNGYNADDVNSSIHVKYKPTEILTIGLEGSYKLIEPELYYKNFISNHFKWINDSLEKEQTIYFGAKVKLEKYRLTLFANAKLRDNFMYFDTLVNLIQHDFATNNISLGVEKDYRIYKFHFKTALIYQITSDDVIMPLPNIVARQVVYYENKLFKRSLKVRVGANASFTSDYYAYEFMPSISQFYAQNKNEIGAYPYVDFFISTHLKRAQVFFKWEHINAGMSGYSYLLTPTTPAHDRSFKFGVSWNMFD